MAIEVLDLTTADLTSSRRTLLLVWQDPSSGRFIKVGQIDALPKSRLAFHYLESAWDASNFVPLVEYPERHVVYISDEVPAFFANRILSADRPGYDHYLEWLGIADLDEADIPFEVLARTGGSRATDTFHVVDAPTHDESRLTSRFFVSGIRHTDDADAVLASLSTGDRLALVLESSNPKNPKAVLINTTDGRKIGYVPDWLCGDAYERIKDGWQVTAVAERVNPDAPAHVRVLCRVDAQLV
jgi:hypothetical protein